MNTDDSKQYNGPFGRRRARSYFERQTLFHRVRRKIQGCTYSDPFRTYHEHDGLTINTFCVLCGRCMLRSNTIQKAIDTLDMMDAKAARHPDPKEVYSGFLLWLSYNRSFLSQSLADLAAAGHAVEFVKRLLTESEMTVVREKAGGLVTVWDTLEPDEFNKIMATPGDRSLLEKHRLHYCASCKLAFCGECIRRSAATGHDKVRSCPECLANDCEPL